MSREKIGFETQQKIKSSSLHRDNDVPLIIIVVVSGASCSIPPAINQETAANNGFVSFR